MWGLGVNGLLKRDFVRLGSTCVQNMYRSLSKTVWEIVHLVSFNYKNISWCMVLWMSNSSFNTLFIVLHFFLLLNFVVFNPLNAELNPICHLLALLGADHILHVSRITVKLYLFVICNYRNIQINRKNLQKNRNIGMSEFTTDKLLNGCQHASMHSPVTPFFFTHLLSHSGLST